MKTKPAPANQSPRPPIELSATQLQLVSGGADPNPAAPPDPTTSNLLSLKAERVQ
jgi:hypothetical protein